MFRIVQHKWELAAFLALACIVHAIALPALAILALSYSALMVLDTIAARDGQAPMFFERLRPSQLLIAEMSLLALIADV